VWKRLPFGDEAGEQGTSSLGGFLPGVSAKTTLLIFQPYPQINGEFYQSLGGQSDALAIQSVRYPINQRLAQDQVVVGPPKQRFAFFGNLEVRELVENLGRCRLVTGSLVYTRNCFSIAWSTSTKSAHH